MSALDGVGLGIDLLAIEETLDLLAALVADGGERLLGDGEHAAKPPCRAGRASGEAWATFRFEVPAAFCVR